MTGPTTGPTSDVESLRRRARVHQAELGFTMSSDDETGTLLAVLAAAVPAGGRILELGTGVGVGLCSLLAGLHGRTDVEVVTVEADEKVASAARDNDWPPFVRLVVGDAVELLPSLGRFHLVFADAQGGKWYGLDRSIDAVEPGGMLVVDDMTASDTDPDTDPELNAGISAGTNAKQAVVRDTLLPPAVGELRARVVDRTCPLHAAELTALSP